MAIDQIFENIPEINTQDFNLYCEKRGEGACGGYFVLIQGPQNKYYISFDYSCSSHPVAYEGFFILNNIPEEQKDLFNPMGGGIFSYLRFDETNVELEITGSSMTYGRFDKGIVKILLERNLRDIQGLEIIIE